MTVKKSPQTLTALEKSAKARELWLQSKTLEDLDEVEELLKEALNSKLDASSVKDDETHNSRKSKKPRKQFAELTPTEYRKTGERLSLLYCQSGRTARAKKGLEYLGFSCRLAKDVLDYPPETRKHRSGNLKGSSDPPPPCIILDNFLHDTELQHLRSVFEPRQANYWAVHNYNIEPPSPYFSHVIDLSASKGKHGFIEKLARQIRQSSDLQAKFPDLQHARYVEMWAHNRPHASGHQLHFDSDDEGRGGKIRNPVCSTILYLSATPQMTNDGSSDSGAGGPSLVTNQRLTSTKLATQGWLAHPKPLRLVAFDGTVLHGVIPGKGAHPGRRVTLMLAFWKNIQIRNDSPQGSARPFPSRGNRQDPSDTTPDWVYNLTDSKVPVQKARPAELQQTAPVPLRHVYETLDGETWKPTYGMPDYEEVFQGF